MISRSLKARAARTVLRGSPQALLACESGGRTDVTYLLAAARRLRGVGVECRATIDALQGAAEFAALGIPSVAGYLWPGQRRWVPHDQERPEVWPLDTIANLGLAQPDWVAAALAHYDGLFALFRPGIVLAANAPGALLAARGRVPAIALGSSRHLPPAVDGRFPAFDGSATASSWADEDVLDGLNAALELGGRPPLTSIADILAEACVMPFGPSELDPFSGLRPEPVLPPNLAGRRPAASAGSGEAVFVDLRGEAYAEEATLAALLSVRRPLRVLGGDLDDQDRELVSEAGLAIETEGRTLSAVVDGARAVIHHGDADLTAACLAAGLPQILLAIDPEHERAGRLLEREGLGAWRRIEDATTAWTVEAVRRAYDDEALQARCKARGSMLATWIGGDPTRAVAYEACGLLRIRPPPENQNGAEMGGPGPEQAREGSDAPPAPGEQSLLARLRGLARRCGRRPRGRALLAWEYGAGHTHIAHILAVARHLRAAGVDCLATLHDPRAHRFFGAIGVHTVQNYAWPHSRRNGRHDRERPYAGFLDLLGNLGFGDLSAVKGALAHYDGLFAAFDPDIVIAENAYGAHLAARGRVRTLAFGFGQFLPPVVEGPLEPTSWSEGEILSGIGQGMRRCGRQPLERVAELFETDAMIPYGPAAFDLFSPMRPRPALPVHIDGFRPGTRVGSGSEIFVYLQGLSVGTPAIMAALLAAGRPMRAYIPDLAPDDRAVLLRASIRVEDALLPIESIVRRSRCVLHHGGVGLTAVCLSAGLPQVILSRQLDQRVSGEYVAREGFGDHAPQGSATTAWTVEAARRAYDDVELQGRCRLRAPEFDAWFGPDPAAVVAAEACRLLALPRPSLSAADGSPTGRWAGHPASARIS